MWAMSSATFSWLSSASAPTLASRPLLRRLVVGAESEAARRVARPIAADEAEHTRVRGRGLVLLRIGRSLRGLHQLRGQYRGLRWTDKLWPKDGYRSRAPKRRRLAQGWPKAGMGLKRLLLRVLAPLFFSGHYALRVRSRSVSPPLQASNHDSICHI